MISRIKQNFTDLMESINSKKDEILKQNKIINLESILSLYKENKKIVLNKKEVLSLIEKLDVTYINELIEKVEKFYEDNYIEKIESDIRKKVVEKLKKIIKFSKVIYINFIDKISNYSLNDFSKKPERAPPVNFTLYLEI